MSYVGKITISCPRRGHIVKRVKGSSGSVVHKMFTFKVPKSMGPACTIVSREIIKKPSRKKGH